MKPGTYLNAPVLCASCTRAAAAVCASAPSERLADIVVMCASLRGFEPHEKLERGLDVCMLKEEFNEAEMPATVRSGHHRRPSRNPQSSASASQSCCLGTGKLLARRAPEHVQPASPRMRGVDGMRHSHSRITLRPRVHGAS